VESGNVVWLGFLCGFDQTWKGTTTRDSNVVTGVELGESEENLTDLFDVLGKTWSQLFNEYDEHLDCAVFFFDFVGHDALFGSFGTGGGSNFLENSFNIVTSILSLNLHLSLESNLGQD